MIQTVAQLLENFREYALSKIKEEDNEITHPVAIGDNYEGLTTELLSRAIFKNLNLRLVEKSFIYNDSGNISQEMDCMLVVGEGKKMSYANRYQYHIKDIIAAIQVKKNLFANEIDDSHHNLRSIMKIAEAREPEEYVGRMWRNAYKLIISKDLPTIERKKEFSFRENYFYHYLRLEAFYPLRIVIGYYGYKNEHSLREGFVKKIESIIKDTPIRGYGPGSFPNLYICGNNSIIKNNGMPMGAPFSNDEYYYDVLLSSNGKAMYHLLELIWTRLSYKYQLDANIFNDNAEIETVHRFISCKERKIDDINWGWDYYYHEMEKEYFKEPLLFTPWEPVQLDNSKFIILNYLNSQGIIDMKKDKEFLELIKSETIDLNNVIKELSDNKLIYNDLDELGILPDELSIVFANNGKIYAGESNKMLQYFSKLQINPKPPSQEL